MIKQMNVEVTYELYVKLNIGRPFDRELPYRYLETYDTRREANEAIQKSLSGNPAFADCLEFRIEEKIRIIKDGD